MRVRDIYLNGIGVFLPEQVLSVESAVAQGWLPAERAPGLGFSGVRVAGDLPAPEMALHALRDGLTVAEVAPGDVAALLYTNLWHQGPEGWGPQYYLQHHLLGDELLAVEIKHGCSGVFSCIELAVCYLRAAAEHRAVAVVTADNFGTPGMDRWAPGFEATAMGDGGCAAVLTRDPGPVRLESICTTTYSDMEVAQRGNEPLFPPGVTVGRRLDLAGRLEAFKKKIIEEGVEWRMSLEYWRRTIDSMKRALAEAEIGVEDVKRVLIHTLSREEVQPYLGALGFSLEQSTWEFGSHIGHIGAGDHIVSLHHLLATGQLEPGDHVLLCGFSPGVTYKAAVMQVVSPTG